MSAKSVRGGGPGQYLHKKAKRKNNPHAGLPTSEKESETHTKKYEFEPHLDPQLLWHGKHNKTEFEVDSVSLHVHERIDPMTIIEKALKTTEQQTLIPFFEQEKIEFPYKKAIEFYKHEQNWSNRLIVGDSLLVMNSLIEKEGIGGKVQMVYIDPPYGIKYASNFQPFISKQDVTEADEDMSQEPETILAFRDIWEKGIHSYLTYLRTRLILSKHMLADTGSCFVQISIDNMHLVRNLMDEVFGAKNFINVISYRTKQGVGSKRLPTTSDYIVWYAKDITHVKYNKLYLEKEFGAGTGYTYVEMPKGERRKMNEKELNRSVKIPKGAKIYQSVTLMSSGYTEKGNYEITIDGKVFKPGENKHWKTNRDGMEELMNKNRIQVIGNTPRYVMYYDDLPGLELTNVWTDTQGAADKKYVVQTADKIIQRCMLMSSDTGDLVFDPTCGSGTTAYIAEKFGRRWITCDTSRIAITIAKQRIMTSVFKYYKLARTHATENSIQNGFEYEQIPHVTLEQIAQKKPSKNEIIYDKPLVDKTKHRISGPFTVEAVPALTVKSVDALYSEHVENSEFSLTKMTNYQTQQQWRDELEKSGIKGRKNQKIIFSRIETHPATRWIHAIGETIEETPHQVAISFGPEYAPLDQQHVKLAIEEAKHIVPKISMVVFAAMHFDPEASKNIDKIKWQGVTVLKVEMNKDLLTKDLKKEKSSNESFWLIGQPDVTVKRSDKEYVVEVNGFDYFDTEKDTVVSSDEQKIVMWMLDTDYDGRSIYPQQIFFPMKNIAGSKGLEKLSKTLRAEINEDVIMEFFSTKSHPFPIGHNKRAAVKIVDDRGVELIKIIELTK